jgi:predicted RNA-binding Zn ribbon-like protein
MSGNDKELTAADAVVAFANTHVDGAGHVEQFADADTLSAWLHGVAWLGVEPEPEPDSVTDADAVEARQLRDALVTVLLAHVDDPTVSDADAARAEVSLHRAGRRYPVVADLGLAGARLRPVDAGLPGVLAHVLGAATEIALSGQWPRMKACRNEPCHTAFVDRSKNTSGAYCSPQCASQASMRAYRARRRKAAETHDGDSPQLRAPAQEN